MQKGRMSIMKKRIQGFVAGALAATMIGCVPTVAKEAVETITAVYHNVKLVVDGVLIEPKTANGTTVEPFIYNGTTYLPVRAVATALEKEVVWDQANYTVFLGDVVDKPAKELPLWNRSYLECSYPAKVEFYEEKGDNYIKMYVEGGEEVDDGRYYREESITYAVNTLAKSINGEFSITDYYKSSKCECILKILGTNGKVLYKSPIIRASTTSLNFDVDIEDELEVTILIENTHSYKKEGANVFLKNVNIVSSDY